MSHEAVEPNNVSLVLKATRMPIAPGTRLRLPGGPTGGPYGGKSSTICPTRTGHRACRNAWAYKRHWRISG